jgi:hypothetical protein
MLGYRTQENSEFVYVYPMRRWLSYNTTENNQHKSLGVLQLDLHLRNPKKEVATCLASSRF